MYKFLLCLRYLRTRYIALASIISVTLGVATMIVVNSVMAGFSTEMRDRIHGLLADVIIETHTVDGEPDPQAMLERVRKVAGDDVAGMTTTVEIYGMLTFKYAGDHITRPVTIIGIDPQGKAQVGPLVDYLDSYATHVEDGRVVRKPLRSRDVPPGWELTDEAKQKRAEWAELQRSMALWASHGTAADEPAALPIVQTAGTAESEPPVFDAATAVEPPEFVDAADIESPGTGGVAPPEFLPAGQVAPPVDPAEPLAGRLFIGLGLISYPHEDPATGKVKTHMMVRPGDDVKLSTITAGSPPEPVHFDATVVDVFKSGMSEYDSSLVFCDLNYLQNMRGMIAPQPGKPLTVGQPVQWYSNGRKATGKIVAVDLKKAEVRVRADFENTDVEHVLNASEVTPIARRVTSIQIKLKEFHNSDAVVERLKAAFPPELYRVQTWEQKQGPLLAAVDVESTILNVLLFLIIAVAGFGILAIFFMIVVEKTRDIGILKALGASSRGVMAIFLSYGLGLGIVGSGVGTALGLLFVHYINEIEKLVTAISGRKVFDERIYYFPEIPTDVSPVMVLWVAVGAVTIAVLASILPARRAAGLHPVEALRYE
ncbi:MAG: FtsX-like permease family protein [Planctomycetaceae bacterium]